MSVTIKFRRGNSTEWTANGNVVLASGEPGYEVDTGRFKIGNGSTIWNNLPYASIIPTGFLAGSGISLNLANNGASLTINSSGATISNYGDNRVLTSDGTSTGINGESNLTFNGSLLNVNGNLTATTGNFTSLQVGNIPVSISGHSHTSSNITDFNSAVSGLLPVKDIVAGTGIVISSNSGIYTIISNGSGVLADRAAALVTTVFNKTANTINKGSVVYINGGQGDQPTIQLAIANGESGSSKTYGITAESIPSMSLGQVIVAGALTGFNTDQYNPSAPQGDVNGITLYLSPTTSGAMTTSKPYAPNHLVSVGTIVRTHQNEGVIEVRIQNGFELDELHNVAITGALNGQFLQYNASSGLWLPSSSGNFTTLQVNNTVVSLSGHTHTTSDITNFNSSVSGLVNGIYAPLVSPSLTGTPLAPTAPSGTNTNQIATTSFVRTEISNLVDSAPSTLDTLNELAAALGDDPNFATTVTNNIASKIGGSGTTNYISKFTGTKDIGNSLLFDNGTGVGIGTTSPSATLHINGSGKFNSIDINNSVIAGQSALTVNGGVTTQGSFVRTSAFSMYGDNLTQIYKPDSSTLGYAVANSSYRHVFGFNNVGTHTPWATINSTGLGIGTTTPAYKLDIIGTGNFSQNLLVSGIPIAELIDDEVASLLTAGSGISLSYNDASNSLTISTTGLQSSLSNPVTGTGISNHIAYWDSTNVITADSGQLFWDATNNRLGIGTNSPIDLIHISGSTNNSIGIRFDNNDGYGGSIQADNGQLHLNSSTATAARLSGRKIRVGDGTTNACAIELSSVGTISQDGNGGGLSFSGTIGQFSNGLHVTAGNLGVGTSTPSGILDVRGASYFGSTGVANNLYLRAGQSGISETALRLRTDVFSNLYLDASNAYVKVGNQSADVDIVAGNAGIRIGHNAAQTLNNQNIRFVPANTERMRITPTGIGIGTTSPVYNLDVNGSGNFSSGLYVNNISVSISGHNHNGVYADLATGDPSTPGNSIVDRAYALFDPANDWPGLYITDSTVYASDPALFDSFKINMGLFDAVIGTGIANHIPYWNSTNGLVADSGQLYWDSSNHRLGIGTNGPLRTYHQAGGKFLLNSSEGGWGQFQLTNPTNGEVSAVLAAEAIIENDGSITSTSNSYIWAFGIGSYGNSPDKFIIGNNNIGGAALTVTDNGYVGIGTTTPNSELEVNGSLKANNIFSSGYLISNYLLSINDFDGGTPGSIGIGEFTSLDQMFWSINQNGSGNFSALGVNDVSVSLEGHTHTSNAITDFNSSVSGLLPTITNSGDNRVLTSTGSVNGINGESNLTFNGSLLSVTGSGLISEDLRIGALKAYRWNGNAWGYDRIVFREDVNNKITSDANGNYNWLVASKNWTLSDAARVGIRTISPSSIMHIEGSITDNASLLITGGVANNRVYLGNGNSDAVPFLASVALNDLTNSVYGWGIFDRGTDGDFRISRKSGSTAWTTVLHAQRLTGNIGIGTGTQATSPPERLVVDGNLRLADTAGSTGNRLQLFRGGGGAYDYTFSKEGNHLAISTSNDAGTNRFTQFGYHTGSTWTPKTVINNFNGFIGVNTLSPSAALVVASTGNSNINLANFTNTGGTTRAAISLSSAGDGVFSLIDASNNTDILFSSNTGTSSYINAGRFGIGTTTPSGTVHIVGTGIVSSISGIAPNAMWHVYSSGSGDTVLNVEGTNGSLFAVVDNLSGSLMSVNNNAGLPVFEVFSDDRIVGGRFGQNDWVVSSGGNVGIGTGIPSFKLHVIGTGNFTQNVLVNGTGVSISGHTHTTSDITNFNTAVSGLFPTVTNSGDNRILTSTGTATGLNAESNLTFDGNLLNITGSGFFSNGLTTNTGNFTTSITGALLNIDNIRIDGNTITATNTNGSLIITPTGTGCLQANIGGNSRGQYAVDLQLNRAGVPASVAAGNYSNILGGYFNTISVSGHESSIIGGQNNGIFGFGSLIAGAYSYCGAQRTALVGTFNTCFKSFGHALGSSNTLNASSAIAIGNNHFIGQASGVGSWTVIEIDNNIIYFDGNVSSAFASGTPLIIYSHYKGQANYTATDVFVNSDETLTAITVNTTVDPIFGPDDLVLINNVSDIGIGSVAIGNSAKCAHIGELGYANSSFSSTGDAQHSILIPRIQTSTNTANVVLTLDGAPPGSTNRLVIQPQTTWTFNIKLSAYNSSDNTAAWWIFRGGIRRNAVNGTSLIGSVITENDSESTMSTASASVVADDTNEALEIRVTGLTNKVIRWVAVVELTQVSWI